MMEWDFYVISVLYEKIVEWGGDIESFALFLATTNIKVNPEVGGFFGLPELNLRAYASRDKLQEILGSETSLSERRKQCMVTLQREHPLQYESLEFPPDHLKGLLEPQHSRRVSYNDNETMAGYYSEVEDTNRRTFEKLWCFSTDIGLSGMYFVAVRVSLMQYQEVVDLLTDIYGTSEQGLRADIIEADEADAIYRSLMLIYNRKYLQKRRSRSS